MEGGNSSKLSSAVTMCTSQPRRRSNAASSMSWLRIWPPKGARPGSSGRPQLSAKARTRTIALWPQNIPSEPAHQIMPAAEIGPNRRLANCCQRANRVAAPMTVGTVWIRPTWGCRSMSAASRAMVWPLMMLSASSTII